ncbi:DUF6318 family protein [Arthrobacter koreensis]|uniref:DUF6318 family protein n=1 Tax=Arthrobacter koreensis TaxID=199136 RepID=UPI0036DBBECF
MSSLGVRRQFAAVSLALAGALVLGACSGSDDPDADAAQSPSSPVSPSTSSTPSPTPTATYKPASAEGPAENVPLPEMPEEAKVESKEGLIAFARYWYELVNYGYETGDVEPVKAISGPDCFACQSLYSGMGDVYGTGGWIQGGDIEILTLDSDYQLTPEGRRQVLVSVKQRDMVYWDGTGNADRRPGDEISFLQIMEISFEDDGWYVHIAESTGD